MITLRTSALICILTVSAYLFLTGTRYQQDSVGSVSTVGAPSMLGFIEIQTGVFQSVKIQNEFHSLDTPIALVPDAYYRIRYDIRDLPRQKVKLTSDFYASGYDNPEQEINKIVGMNDLGSRQDFIFNSGKSPNGAYFRISYSGAPGLDVANIQITQVATWYIWLKRLLMSIALGSLLVFIVAGIKRIQHRITLSQTRDEANPSKILAAEIPILFAIYLFAVLLRFSIYIIMPYWSGDEYVYKSIAAGIWHFGQSGHLTNSMIGNTVELPNLLYPYLISPAFVLGENFYTGVRLINAVVMNAAIFPCYLIARKYLNQKTALFAATISISIPFINIGAYAVTEVLFFPLFLFGMWVAIESIERKNSISWAIGFGLVSALLMNVRLTAMVMLPAYIFSIWWLSIKDGQVLKFITRPYWICSVVSFLLFYISIKYALDGKAFADFGIYGSVAKQSAGPFSIISHDPFGTINLIAGHLTTLAIPYALPIALMIITILPSRRQLTLDRIFYDFLVIAFIFSLSLFSLALIFTIGVSPFDLGGLGRWHSRYYFYFYPLVIIAGVAFADRLRHLTSVNLIGIQVAAALLLLTNMYFIKIHGISNSPWFGSIVDNMDVQWYRTTGKFYWIFIALTFGLVWLWHKRSIYFTKFAVCVILSWAVVANYGSIKYLNAADLTLSTSCGELASNFLDHNPGRFIITGDSPSAMVNAAFWNPYIPEKTFIYSDATKQLNSSDIGISAKYLVANGAISVDPAYRPILSIGKCTIYEIPE